MRCSSSTLEKSTPRRTLGNRSTRRCRGASSSPKREAYRVMLVPGGTGRQKCAYLKTSMMQQLISGASLAPFMSFSRHISQTWIYNRAELKQRPVTFTCSLVTRATQYLGSTKTELILTVLVKTIKWGWLCANSVINWQRRTFHLSQGKTLKLIFKISARKLRRSGKPIAYHKFQVQLWTRSSSLKTLRIFPQKWSKYWRTCFSSILTCDIQPMSAFRIHYLTALRLRSKKTLLQVKLFSK